jgi:transcriptional regulator with XRE-family HTH domain
MNFHDRLKALVAERGEPQNVVAAACGMSPGALSQYLSGNVPKADQLLSLAKYFGVTAEWLLNGEGVRTIYEAWLQEQSSNAAAALQEDGGDVAMQQLQFELSTMRKRAEQAESALVTLREQQLSFWAQLDPTLSMRLDMAGEKPAKAKRRKP